MLSSYRYLTLHHLMIPSSSCSPIFLGQALEPGHFKWCCPETIPEIFSYNLKRVATLYNLYQKVYLKHFIFKWRHFMIGMFVYLSCSLSLAIICTIILVLIQHLNDKNNKFCFKTNFQWRRNLKREKISFKKVYFGCISIV